MKNLVIHLVSESSGQTVRHAASTAVSRFNNLKAKTYQWPMVRNVEMLKEVFETIKKKPGVVLYTISNDVLCEELKSFCFGIKIPAISVVSTIVKEISEYMSVDVAEGYTNTNKFDDTYFDKVEAIEYTLNHDDGNEIEGINEADIVLIGPSRTSKTPTSIYLAYNGFKIANIPLVHGHDLPQILYETKGVVIVGLIINPSRLVEIRENRMNLLCAKENSNYTDVKIIQEECRQTRMLCRENNWKIIDVSTRSIEESAAIIMKNYYEEKKRRSA